MDISVIVPIYGVEKYIEKCLRSLFEQTKTDGVEFILVNDCTSDSSMDVVRKVQSEYTSLAVKIIEHPVNRGLAAARQTGLDIATGDYLINVDSDDWCESTMLGELYAKAKQDDADVVISNIYINKADKETCLNVCLTPDPINAIRDIIRGSFSGKGMTHGKLVRRSLFVNNNISYISGINYSEDLVMCIKLCSCAQKVSYLNRAFHHYIQHTTNMTGNKANRDKWLNESVQAFQEITNYLNNKYNDLFYSDLSDMKLQFKYMLLQKDSGVDQHTAVLVFPESNSHIFKSKKITAFHNRVAFYLATNNYIWASNIIWSLSSKIKRIK